MIPGDCPHSIAVSDDGKYVIVRISGDMRPSLALEVTLEAHRLGRELNVNRFLLDFRECRNTGSVYENYSFAYDDTQIEDEIDASARVALLISPEDRSHEFSVTVGRNSGKNLTPFTTLEAAIRHLVKD